MSRERSIASERGITMVEMMVSVALGMIVILGIFALTEVAIRSSARTAARVDADQRARPVLQRLVDELHSTCIGPEAGPILAGSDENEIIFLHQTGSAVGPTPDRRVVTLTGSTLSESVYPSTGGEAPNWTFSPTPSSTRQLLTDVGPAALGDPPVLVPTFQYYAYDGGAVDPEPLDVPLTAERAPLTVQVTVAFSVAPRSTPVPDDLAAVSVADSILVRFSPASEDPTKVNGPCV